LTSPVDPTQTPRQPTIVLRFTELIDTTGLTGPINASSPVNIVLRGTTTINGDLACDFDQAGIALQGLPQLSTERVGERDVTVFTFTPSFQLPALSCLVLNVTADVRDLSGRAAVPQQIEMFTVAGTPQVITISESFGSTTNQDLVVSSSPWTAGARPGLVGGDGRHGSFDPTIGTLVGGVYEWNTDNITIPGSKTLNGTQYTVTDGKFYFTDFTLPVGTTVRFKGNQAPQIWVRGRVSILGTLDVSGAELPAQDGRLQAAGQRVSTFDARGGTSSTLTYPNTPSPFISGQTGGDPGPGGGRGGRGGDECDGTGDPIVNGVHVFYGRDGETVKVPAGHAYAAQIAGTGGKGAPMFPTTGTNVSLTDYQQSNIWRWNLRFGPGGGGGGYSGPGGQASATTVPTQAVVGPTVAASNQFALLPLPSPLPGNFTSLNHFLVGGSGGGGGGSHMYGTRQFSTSTADYYLAGSAGTGGGGAVALRAGSGLTVGTTGKILARGGAGVVINGDLQAAAASNMGLGVSSPGGGGSGGSILLQLGTGTMAIDGIVDVAGGQGSRTGFIQDGTSPGGGVGSLGTIGNIVTQAGNGSAGFYRLETGTGLPVFAGTGVPAYVAGTNSGTLTDRDQITGGQSKWRSTAQFFPPTWVRYELDVDVDGDGTIDTTYTDSGDAGTLKASDPNGPVIILFQGARLNQAGTAPEAGTTGPWREGIGSGAGPGIYLDAATGVRFMLLFNSQQAPNCIVRALRIIAQT
jgi:hypothetical protein